MHNIYAKANVIKADLNDWENFILFLENYNANFYFRDERKLTFLDFKIWYLSENVNDVLIAFDLGEFEIYCNVSDKEEICIFFHAEPNEFFPLTQLMFPFLQELSIAVKREVNFTLHASFDSSLETDFSKMFNFKNLVLNQQVN